MFVALTPFVFRSFAACNKFLGIEGWYKYIPKTDEATCKLNFEANNIGTVWLIILGLIDILLRIGIIAAVIFFIIGAFKMVASQGSPEGVNSARSTMTNALIGLVLLIVSTWLISFFVYNVFKVS
jgi:hypothetical protein